MTDRELLKEARDRLHGFAEPFPTNWSTPEAIFALLDRIDAALAAPPSTGPLEDVHGVVAGDAKPEPIGWAQLGTMNGQRYIRLVYDRHPYPPPPYIVRNLNLVPLYAAPPSTDDARDAARYRWLRGDGPPHSLRWARWEIRVWSPSNAGPFWASVSRDEMDQLVDAAMRAQGESK